MILATIIIVVHSIVPHQHRAQIEVVIHECLFSDSEGNNSSGNIFEKLEDAIKHLNLGEKHLENFRISSYEYEFSFVNVFEIPEILTLFKFRLQNVEKVNHFFYYNAIYTIAENKLGYGLRAPPCV